MQGLTAWVVHIQKLERRRLAWPLRKDDAQNREAFHKKNCGRAVCGLYLIKLFSVLTKNFLLFIAKLRHFIINYFFLYVTNTQA